MGYGIYPCIEFEIMVYCFTESCAHRLIVILFFLAKCPFLFGIRYKRGTILNTIVIGFIESI